MVIEHKEEPHILDKIAECESGNGHYDENGDVLIGRYTPIENGPKIKSDYANIDTGCFYTAEPGYGVLTALQFPEMVVYQQDNVG